MDRLSATLLMTGAGAALATQAPINLRLARSIGTWPAALVSFTVGALVLFVICVVAGRLTNFSGVGGAPWWAFVGGAIGAALVTSTISTVGTLGAGGIAATAIAGQLTASVVIDRFGLFGLRSSALTLGKVAGILLLALGAWLILRER
ncbi:unannotated protein [freshwater metagenome]|uniref:Unannotated protein n=1 Tax=freshwater metagenome TaxID=449393 RepID=A0A6J7E216_9ZZZZ|nr:EamA-like transporter family protein [Actinomycetota bacterium]